MEEKNIQESIEKIKKDTESILKLDHVRELIKNNVYEFDYGGVKYRVKKPNFEDKYAVSTAQSRKYIEMLKDSQYVLEGDLIKIYEARGINIKEMDKKFEDLTKEKQELDKRLGKALEDKLPEEELSVFVKEIEKIEDSQKSLIMEKSVLLNDSLESQIAVYSYTYLAYVITEKDIAPKTEPPGEPVWVKAWNTYIEFIKSDESLVNILVWYTMFMGKDEIKPVG